MPDKLLPILQVAAETAPQGLDLTNEAHLLALSTTTDLQPYLPMLQAMVAMYRTYLPESPEAEVFAGFIDDPAEFGDWAGVPAEVLRRAAVL